MSDRNEFEYLNMSAIEGALEHAEETSKLYRETTVKIKQPAGGYLRVSKHLKLSLHIWSLNNMGFGSGDKVVIFFYIYLCNSKFSNVREFSFCRKLFLQILPLH